MRVFNIKDVLLRLKEILAVAEIKHLYIFVDDFSELPEDAAEPRDKVLELREDLRARKAGRPQNDRYVVSWMQTWDLRRFKSLPSKKYEALLSAVAPHFSPAYRARHSPNSGDGGPHDVSRARSEPELDKSHQLVGRRGKNLAEKGLVSREFNEHDRRVFGITQLARESYFARVAADELDVPADPDDDHPV